MTIFDLLEADGFSSKKVASTGGGEYAGPCPFCGGINRFRCWPTKGEGGAGGAGSAASRGTSSST
jgi:DNA primase